MNKVILMGYLCKAPELHRSKNEKQTAVTRFDIAIDRKGKTEEERITDYFHCMVFAKQAEFVEKYFDKGSKILVTGRMENNNYTNKDGEKVYGYQVIVEEVEFAGSRKEAAEEADDTDE
ncbi:MAG: single-stranded DNA-binding protein [Eubacterium sp.]|nr:single-stranded DNA-binding protein [Eubacterium sp.]